VSVHTAKTHPHAAMYICGISATVLQPGNSDITATVWQERNR
jgi:hypothetical protein